MRQKLILTISGIVLLAAGASLGYFVPRLLSSSSSSSAFPLINQTVTSNLDKHFIINFKPLKDEMAAIQKKYSQKTYIYFDYLNNAAWVGLGERDLFTAASTIKVPLAMAIFKAIEEKKLKIDDRYSLSDLDLNADFGELYKVGPDNEFTVEELIKIMLEQSDNTAMTALYGVLKNIGIDDPFSDVYTYMGWDTFPAIGEVPSYQKINLKTLSNMFITLYNAKYLSVKNSQKILEYLSNSPFNDKIVASVPEGMTVAHKIGVATGEETFSDCGIVYAPNRHYLLCLGSNGGDEKVAAKFMAEISAAVYKYVINN